jgi:hypothetical protein
MSAWVVGADVDGCRDPREELPVRNDGTSGADRDRTGDPLVANQVLSQLSYRPEDATRYRPSGPS